MSDLPSGSWPAGLPESGALLFFGDTDLEDGEPDSSVIHVETPEAFAPCPPPADTPPLYGEDWHYYIREARSEAAVPRSFGKWPLHAEITSQTTVEERKQSTLFDMRDLVPFNRHGVMVLDGCINGLEMHQKNLPIWLGNSEANLARLREAVKPVGTGERIVSLLGFRSQRDRAENERLHKQLEREETVVSRHTAELAQLTDEAPGLIAELDDLHRRIGVLDPVARMSDENEILVKDISRRASKLSGLGGVDLNDVLHDAVVILATEDRDLFSRLPQRIRDWVDDPFGAGWLWGRVHQMFGTGLSIHGAPEKYADKVMLAQFNSDMRLRWLWGDVGVLQVWIAPQDMAAGRWDKAFMTFEGH